MCFYNHEHSNNHHRTFLIECLGSLSLYMLFVKKSNNCNIICKERPLLLQEIVDLKLISKLLNFKTEHERDPNVQNMWMYVCIFNNIYSRLLEQQGWRGKEISSIECIQLVISEFYPKWGMQMLLWFDGNRWFRFLI